MRCLVGLALVGLAACASSQPGGAIAGAPEVPIGSSAVRLRSADAPTVRAVPFPLARVWDVLPAILDSLGVPATERDAVQHVIGNSGFKVHQRLGTVALGKLIDCGSTQGYPSAEEYDIRMSVLTQLQSDGAGGTNISTRVEADGRPMAFSGPYTRCASTGALEERIAAAVVRRLQ